MTVIINGTTGVSFPDSTNLRSTNALTLTADLASTTGSNLVGFTSGELSALAITAQVKLRETVSIESFRIITDGSDNTPLVQRAFDSGKPVKFTQNYNVTAVMASTVGGYIDFNGFSLTGIQPTGAAYVLAITGRFMTFFSALLR